MTATIVASNVKPEYAAPERYKGDWVVSAYMGRAHLVKSATVFPHAGPVQTACGRKLRRTFSATGCAWDGCEVCVAKAEPLFQAQHADGRECIVGSGCCHRHTA